MSIALTDEEILAVADHLGAGWSSPALTRADGVAGARAGSSAAGLRSLAVRGLVTGDLTRSPRLDDHVVALVRAVVEATARVEILVDVVGAEPGEAVPFASVHGAPGACWWTAVTRSSVGINLFESVSVREAQECVDDTLGGTQELLPHEEEADGTDLRVYVIASDGERRWASLVRRGWVQHGTVNGSGRRATFTPTGGPVAWQAALFDSLVLDSSSTWVA